MRRSEGAENTRCHHNCRPSRFSQHRAGVFVEILHVHVDAAGNNSTKRTLTDVKGATSPIISVFPPVLPALKPVQRH